MPRISAREAGRKGGSSRSPAKLAACRRNGFQPCGAEEPVPTPLAPAPPAAVQPLSEPVPAPVQLYSPPRPAPRLLVSERKN